MGSEQGTRGHWCYSAVSLGEGVEQHYMGMFEEMRPMLPSPSRGEGPGVRGWNLCLTRFINMVQYD